MMEPGKLAESMGLEETEYVELLTLFIETSMSDLDGLKSAMVDRNTGQARHTIHSLKGAAGNLGLNTIRDIALEIELEILAGRMSGVSDAVETLKERIGAIPASLEM